MLALGTAVPGGVSGDSSTTPPVTSTGIEVSAWAGSGSPGPGEALGARLYRPCLATGPALSCCSRDGTVDNSQDDRLSIITGTLEVLGMSIDCARSSLSPHSSSSCAAD